nr:MAG TPA_asm: hypothetical protein [Caudoviricetes sp.]
MLHLRSHLYLAVPPISTLNSVFMLFYTVFYSIKHIKH